MHQNLAVKLRQFNYSKNSFIVMIPEHAFIVKIQTGNYQKSASVPSRISSLVGILLLLLLALVLAFVDDVCGQPEETDDHTGNIDGGHVITLDHD